MPGDKWKDEDVALLLHVWADVNVQDKLTKGRKAQKTSEVYNKILSLVKAEDESFNRTAQQVKVKLKGLEYDWRRIRQQNAKSGRDHHTTKFVDILDQIVGPKDRATNEGTIDDHYEVGYVVLTAV